MGHFAYGSAYLKLIKLLIMLFLFSIYYVYILLRALPSDIEEWDVLQITSMEGGFYEQFDCNPNISSWDVSSVTRFVSDYVCSYHFHYFFAWLSHIWPCCFYSHVTHAHEIFSSSSIPLIMNRLVCLTVQNLLIKT